MDTIANAIYERVSSYEFQKEFLMERPNDYFSINLIGVHPKIKEEFDYLWKADEIGLL